ncbi:MAG: L-threonylcarbamoyladenylate synthase [Candidatus Eisenbacteria bacterium]
MELLSVDPLHPAPGPVREAAEAVLRGGVIAFLGDAGYVLSCSIMDPDAVEFVHRLKRRTAPLAAVALISDAEAIHPLVDSVPGVAEPLMRRHWPGPLSILFPASSLVPARVRGQGGKIALRVPAAPLARALLDAVGGPLMASSANLTGAAAAGSAGAIVATFGNQIDIVLDAGPVPPGAQPATLVDVTSGRVVVVRAGGVDLGRPGAP